MKFSSRPLAFIFHHLWALKHAYGFVLLLYLAGRIFYHLQPFFLGKIIDETIQVSIDWNALYFYAAGFVFLGLLARGMIFRLMEWINDLYVEPLMLRNIRIQLFEKLQNHSISYFQDQFSGQLADKISNVVNNARSLFAQFTHQIYPTIISYIIISIILFTISVDLVIICLVWGAAMFACNYWLVLKILETSDKVAEKNSILGGFLVDILGNMSSVMMFSNMRKEHKSYSRRAEIARYALIGKNRYAQLLVIMCEAGYILLITAMLGYLLYGVQNDTITPGDFAIVIPLAVHLAEATWSLAMSAAEIAGSVGGIKNGLRTINRKYEVVDKQGAKSLQVKTSEIEMKNLHFGYGEHMVFENFNLKIPAGQKIGLVGPSGAGKSTLVQLLLRLYDIQDGDIRIDGQNIADVQQDSLRDNIAVIPQSTDLLHRSLRENIGYGKIGASDAEIIAAAKKAHAHDFILNMEDKDGNTGYDAKVGERGVKLSGGQRQRIAIARAILKDAPILILDEATSALDSESEKLIQDSLQDLMEGKTVIAIAHRLSTIAHLDRLIILDEGKIIEEGTHDELLEKKGLYAKLWSMQSGGFLKT